VLISLSLPDLLDLSRTAYPNIKSNSIEYYIGHRDDTHSTHELQKSVITMLQLLKKEFSPLNSKRRGIV
jgi:hypothetical protein